MRENFEEKPSSAKRYVDQEFSDDSSSTGSLQQSEDSLRADYSWINHFVNAHPKPFSVSPGELTSELMRLRFREKGDPTFRVIPADVDVRELRVAHSYLDTRAAEDDINVVFPLTRLWELEEENFVGSVAAQHFSFTGYLPYPKEIEPHLNEVINQLKRDQVNVAVLTPGEVLSHQTAALLQCAIEKAGIATVSIALCRDIMKRVGAPRAVHYRFPFGFTLGDVNDQATQLRILKDTLRLLEEADEPGTVVDLPYTWVEG